MLILLKWLVLAILTTLIVLFAVMNRHDLTISLFPLPYELQLPVYFLVAVLFLTGFCVAWLLMTAKRAADTLSLRRARQRIDALENELRGLRLSERSLTPL